MTINQTGTKLSGRVVNEDGEFPIEGGVAGDQVTVSWVVPEQGSQVRITMKGTVDGEYIIKLRLWRNTFDLMRGMEDPHDIEMALDGARPEVALMDLGLPPHPESAVEGLARLADFVRNLQAPEAQTVRRAA